MHANLQDDKVRMTYKPYVILYKCVALTDASKNLLADKTGVQIRSGRGCVSPEVSQQRLLGQYSSQQKKSPFHAVLFDD